MTSPKPPPRRERVPRVVWLNWYPLVGTVYAHLTRKAAQRCRDGYQECVTFRIDGATLARTVLLARAREGKR